MSRDSSIFGAVVLGIIIGLVVMLYGVSLNAGQAWNVPMAAGGVITLGAVGLATIRLGTMDSPDH